MLVKAAIEGGILVYIRRPRVLVYCTSTVQGLVDKDDTRERRRGHFDGVTASFGLRGTPWLAPVMLLY